MANVTRFKAPKLRCPNLHCEEPSGPFAIQQTVYIRLDSDGDDITDYFEDAYVDDDTVCICEYCEHTANYVDFKFGPEDYICYPPKEKRDNVTS